MLSLSLALADASLTYCLRSLPIYKTKESPVPKYEHRYGYMPPSDLADFWRDHDKSFLRRWRASQAADQNKGGRDA